MILKLGLAAFACFALGHAASAHQALEVGVPEELGEIAPPLRGSKEFLSEATQTLRLRCDAELAEKLDHLERLVRDAQRVRWGAAPGVDPRGAEYLRSQAEKSLLGLLGTTPGLLEIDLRDLDAVESPFFPVELDAQHSSLLFRVESGAGPQEFSVVEWDLTGEAFDRTTELVVAPRGVTHVLVKLVGVPAERTTFRFAIRRRGEETIATWRGVDLSSPSWGHLQVSLLDDTGEPTPALLSIRSSQGGVYRQPAGAVDLRAQLNDVVGPPVSEPGRGYFFFLPGEKRGRYWIVPSNVEMTLPVGEWEVRALRGPEQVPVVDRVRVTEGEWTRREYRLDRWVDMQQAGWWSGDDHVHARLMHGEDARCLLDYVEAVDLHVANILEMGDPYRTYYAQRGFGPDFRVQREDHWLIPGQEDPRSDLGHAIGLNLKRKVRDLDLYLQNKVLADMIHADGGLYGHTHVGADACFVHREMALFTPLGIVDFNSVMQASLGDRLFYDFLNLGFKMTATAGPDTPYGGTIGSTRVYAYTGQSDRLDPDAWFEAVRRGATFVTNGPMIEFTVNGKRPGETIALSEPGTIEIEATAKGLPGWSSPTELSIIRLGEKIASASSGDEERIELSIRKTFEASRGAWYAARATGRDGSEAHTTPIYVTVGGDRHWDPQRAPEIIRRQLEVLEEIEGMLADSEKLMASRTQLLDRSSVVNSASAEAVRERVKQVRAIYLDLLEQAKRSPIGLED